MVLKDILLMEVEKVLGEKPPLSLYIPKNKKYGDISSNFLIKFDDSVKEKITTFLKMDTREGMFMKLQKESSKSLMGKHLIKKKLVREHLRL